MSFTAVLLIFTISTLIFWIINKINKKHHKENAFADYLGSFFPIVLIVFLLRTFVAEPFVIPSSSMRPGLQPGDFVLVKKFSYGVRTPIINNVLIHTGKIEQGDVVVFNYPPNPDINYIKRIVAVGGDTVEYRDKVLKINGKVANDTYVGENLFPNDENNAMQVVKQFQETLNNKQFDIYQKEQEPTYSFLGICHNANGTSIPQELCQSFVENCEHSEDNSGFICKVPQGKYFAMGDNRDNSSDGRYWGFVDDKYIVGKAWFVWFSANGITNINFKRIGTKVR